MKNGYFLYNKMETTGLLWTTLQLSFDGLGLITEREFSFLFECARITYGQDLVPARHFFFLNVPAIMRENLDNFTFQGPILIFTYCYFILTDLYTIKDCICNSHSLENHFHNLMREYICLPVQDFSLCAC